MSDPSQLNRIERKVDAIDEALRGSPDGERLGLLSRADSTERRVGAIERRERSERRTRRSVLGAAGLTVLGALATIASDRLKPKEKTDGERGSHRTNDSSGRGPAGNGGDERLRGDAGEDDHHGGQGDGRAVVQDDARQPDALVDGGDRAARR